jgi:acylphosphatase
LQTFDSFLDAELVEAEQKTEKVYRNCNFSRFLPAHNTLSMRRLELHIFGEVQGVSYRAFAQREAEKLGLVGYACNLPDGSVEVVVEGKAYELEAFLTHLREKHPFAQVERIEETWSPATGAFSDFRITP